ncbi:MAG: hypothetical protein O9306_08460 [Beijerinckiaceae bacterium]|jgi:hypothetical protein|nr:hypothetical protein [Beijerinckiaceae bacterium]
MVRINYVPTIAWSAYLLFCAPGQAIDFKQFLGNRPNALESELQGLAKCEHRPHSVTLPIVTEKTEIRNDLFNPISGNWFTSESEIKKFTFNSFIISKCTIDRSAIVNFYSFEDTIFSISIYYNRCKKPSYSGACIEPDFNVYSYDNEIYKNISEKGPIYPLDGSSFAFSRAIDAPSPVVKRHVDNLFKRQCGFFQSQLFGEKHFSVKCLLSISLTGDVLEYTTMTKVDHKGYIFDKPLGIFVDMRFFGNISGERKATESFVNSVKEYVDNEIRKLKYNHDHTKKLEIQRNRILGAPSLE